MNALDKNEIQYTTHEAIELSDEEWENLAALTRESFRERAIDGLRMKPNQIYGVGLKHWAGKEGRLIIAQGNTVCGYALYKPRTNRSGVRFIDLEIVAISPEYKRAGIGKRLIEILEQFASSMDCSFIGSVTSTKAKSSVRFHTKCGFEKWTYMHFSHNNYYSICFRKYLNGALRPKFHCFRRWFDWIWTHSRCRESGQISSLSRLKRHVLRDVDQYSIAGEEMSLKEVQSHAFDLLEYFVQFCNQFNLRYMLCYGSLLGAVRHKGFIPWDDDVDVTMPLPDYEKFIDLFIANNTYSHVDVVHGVKHNAIIPFAMLVDKRTAAITGNRDKEHTHPLAIDIFPAFAIPDEDYHAQQHIHEIVKLVILTHKCKNIVRRNPIKYAYRLICNGFVSEHLLNKIDQLIHKYPWGSTQRVRVLSLGETELMALPVDCFETAIDCEFEKGKFKIPAQYHELLSENYGDYRQLPPEEQRIPFSSKVLKIHKDNT